ncbi:MAG: type I restriction-modification system subunit M [Gomphosphaeria aponina SAG 52.96 = DSM 107014]|uniref:site-specific DNA-methyltransferase (adenine-specific) n=1 Tax=Gomphosphaeria aponina SAG 52.96 = DSM 107014 TaxID=1521640 RepID=A0A941JV25_9CHRO|nr:type I restriction-modification system subunit M [Gomphosphaeria aponina SAG 52.96 = DSM 107014]
MDKNTIPLLPVSQDEINSILWSACDTFRGTIDASEYKNYLLVMLFVKYVSDVWTEHYEELKQKYGDDQEYIRRLLARERFVLPEGCRFDDLYRQRNESNLGEIINQALEQIEEGNKAKLAGVFRNIDFNSESNLGQTRDRNVRLKLLLEDFANSKLDLRPLRIGNLDVIGNAYEYLIAKFAAGAGKKAGEFYTPAEVSELIAELIAPQQGERICDPTCGSGSLLIKCVNYVKRQGSKNYSLYGQESTGGTWALAKMNMFLHGVDSARIEWGDTIRNPKLLENDRLMRFEVVVANPPFSLDKWGADDVKNDRFKRFHRGIPPKSKGDFAFISHMIETTNLTSGRVAVVVPHGVLFRASSEGKIRGQLIEENLLDAVIGLPSNLFFGTGIPAAILIFKRNKIERNVIFIDASRDYGDVKTQNILRPEDIKKIVAAYQNRESVDKYAYVASFEEIKGNDFNLNIPRYVDTFEEEEAIDIGAVQSEIDLLETELSEVRSKMIEYLKELKYLSGENYD